MGADGSDGYQIGDSAAVMDVLSILQDKNPVLLVFDPTISPAFASKTGTLPPKPIAALGPLIDVARQTGGTRFSVSTMRARRRRRVYRRADCSTALAGAVVTSLMVMRRW